MQTKGIKTGILKENFDLEETLDNFLRKNHEKLREKDILIITSKVVALAEGRIVNLHTIKPSKKAKKLAHLSHYLGKPDPRLIELILQETDVVFPGKTLTTLKNNILIPSAGIDLSNAPAGHAILWPKNPQKTAKKLWQTFRKRFHLRKLGIIISDSRCQPLRLGTTGIALAWAGFYGIEDARGKKDIYGKPLRVTQKAIADNLASAALVVMGEAGEKIPFAIVRNAPVKFTNRIPRKNEMFVKPEDCIFSGVYNKKVLDQLFS